MDANKFEKHIQEKLKARELQPSVNAWEKLSEKLDDRHPQENKKGYYWYAVAACFVGILIISTLYLVSESSVVEKEIQIVDNPEKESKEAQETNEVTYEVDSNTEVKAKEIFEQKIVPEVTTLNQISHPAKVIVKNEEVERRSNKPDLSVEKSEEIVNAKILEIVTQVNLLEQQQEALTEAEVDSLLRRAQQEILNDKLFRNDNSVDALALLSEVEDELDKSFRDQIFESLKTGFLKVRTAVADRNN